MDSSLTIKPRDNVARSGVTRTSFVRTELSSSQSVTAPHVVAAAHVPLVEPTGREPFINPQAQTLLDREREERLRRRTAREDEALMRQRAYGRPASPPAVTDDRADFEV